MKLHLFLTYQPCHFSSGHVKNYGKPATTSCTQRLLRWSEQFLMPHGCELHVGVSGVYRAHWVDESFAKTEKDLDHYGGRGKSARDGFRLMMGTPGVFVRAGPP